MEKLHALIANLVESIIISRSASKRMADAHHEVNKLVEQLSKPILGPKFVDVSAKIRLIKAVREIHVTQDAKGQAYLGLRDTKEAVERWLKAEGLSE